MISEVYFIVVLHPVESVYEHANDKEPKIWVAAVCTDYSDAETFQMSLLKTLNNGDCAVIIGAKLDAGEGIVDIKAVLENGLN